MKQRTKEGYVYIISNKNFPGYVKVGVTTNIKSRLRSYQTSSPFRDYTIEYYIKHPDCYSAEKKIKENMHYFATDIKNEWYCCDITTAKVRLDETLLDG